MVENCELLVTRDCNNVDNGTQQIEVDFSYDLESPQSVSVGLLLYLTRVTTFEQIMTAAERFTLMSEERDIKSL